MKKILSVMLAALMLLCCIPFAAGAGEPEGVSAITYIQENDSYILGGNTKYYVEADRTLEVPDGTTLYIEAGSSLDVYGTLEVNGKVISRGGILTLKYTDAAHYGKLSSEKGAEEIGLFSNVGGNDSSWYRAEVFFEQLPASFNDPSDHTVAGKYFSALDGSSYADIGNEAAFRSIRYGTDDTASDVITTVYLNQYLFFKTEINSPEDVPNAKLTSKKYDAHKLEFKFNGADVKNAQSVYQIFITSAGKISYNGYEVWDEVRHTAVKKYEWDGEFFTRTYRIYVPSGVGYSVYGVYNGVASAPTETVQLKYKQEFVFRVDIDPEYSDSASEVKVYLVNTYQFVPNRYAESVEEIMRMNNAWEDDGIYTDETKFPCILPFEKGDGSDGGCYIDENGFYHIPAQLMTRECSICVMGVVKNETLSLIAKLLEMFKSLLNSIKQFFEHFFGSIG